LTRKKVPIQIETTCEIDYHAVLERRTEGAGDGFETGRSDGRTRRAWLHRSRQYDERRWAVTTPPLVEAWTNCPSVR
jgi:hypothetical protein